MIFSTDLRWLVPWVILIVSLRYVDQVKDTPGVGVGSLEGS